MTQMLNEAPLTFVFQRWTGHHQSHCEWLLSSLEGVVDTVGGQRKLASAGLSAHLSLAAQRRRAGFGPVLDFRVRELLLD